MTATMASLIAGPRLLVIAQLVSQASLTSLTADDRRSGEWAAHFWAGQVATRSTWRRVKRVENAHPLALDAAALPERGLWSRAVEGIA